jgi:hypothetical protein
VFLASLPLACQRSIDASGLYVNDDKTGGFFPCDKPNTLWEIRDSTLAESYRRTATKPREPVFVRLHGVRSDSGSIYGGAHFLRVQRILEIRPRRTGECPGVANPVPSTLLQPQTGQRSER